MTQWQNDPRRQRPATPPQWQQQGPPQPPYGYGQPQYQPPGYAPQPPQQPKKPRGGLAFLGCGGLGAVAVLIAVLVSSNSSSPPPAAPAGSTATAAAAGPAPAKTLAPLTLGHFPDTADGKLAKAICGHWAGLRQEYVNRAASDSAYQMNQWFSGPAWSKVHGDSAALGDDPAYSRLETALGAGLAGDGAGPASAAAVDRACEAAD